MCWFRKKKNSELKRADDWNSHYFEKDLDSEDWKNLTKDKLNYAIEEARLMMGKVSENTNRLVNKGFYLLTVTGGLIGFVFSLFLLNYTYCIHNFWLILPIALYFICLIIIFYVLFKCIQPTNDLSPVGTPPNLLLRNEFMQHKYKNIMVKQLQNYQGRIDNNMRYNNQMARYIELCIQWFFVCPLILLFIFIITFFNVFNFFYYIDWICNWRF